MIKFKWYFIILLLLSSPLFGQIQHPELITVTDTTAIFFWFTKAKTDSKIVYTIKSSGKQNLYFNQALVSYHYAELKDLYHQTLYDYQISSGIFTAMPNQYSPGKFFTLLPPVGEELFSFAVITDTHVGEEECGVVKIGDEVINEGYKWKDKKNPYWKFTLESAIEKINEKGVAFVIHKGDITSEATPEQFKKAKELLDKLKSPYYVVRGNHDRVGNNSNDFFLQTFKLDKSYYYFDYKNYRFIILDSVDPETGFPEISDQELSFLEETLENSPNFWVVIVLHHPVTEEAGSIFSLFPSDRNALLDILKKFPNIIAVMSGHSHRNKVTHSKVIPEVPFIETSSVKEYPGGYNIYRVYNTGMIQEFYRQNCGNCLKWFEITRFMYDGKAQELKFGDLNERNFVLNYNKIDKYPFILEARVEVFGTSAKISVKTDEPTTVEYYYGINANMENLVLSSNLGKEHTFWVKNLMENMMYFSRVVVKDVAGHKTKSKILTFETGFENQNPSSENEGKDAFAPDEYSYENAEDMVEETEALNETIGEEIPEHDFFDTKAETTDHNSNFVKADSGCSYLGSAQSSGELFLLFFVLLFGLIVRKLAYTKGNQ